MRQLVTIENGRPVTDSLIVAETFGKRHDNVMQDIRNMECSAEFNLLNFQEISYTDSRNRTYPKYIITQDGFSFLVMGYTGKEAARFKEMYIGEFNRMREQLIVNTQALSPELQMFKYLFDATVKVQLDQAEQAKRLTEVEQQQADIKEVLALNPVDGRKKVTALLNKIAQSLGGGSSYQDVRSDSYQRLESRAECNLSIRQTNKRKKMALEGVTKSKIDRVSKLDVIFDDGRLTEIYFSIVKEMAIQNRVDTDGIAS